MDILAIAMLLKNKKKEKFAGKSPDEANADNKDQMQASVKFDPTALFAGGGMASASSLGSCISNLILIVIAMIMSYKKHKDASTEKKIGMMVFAFFLPLFYLIYHFITRNNK
jgi:hypothetical protein